MSANKWTAGPWVRWAGTNIIIRLHSGANRAEDLRICEVSTNTRHDEGRHNGNLIAAAPDLAEALERLIAAYGSAYQVEMRRECWEQARAALAKAQGES